MSRLRRILAPVLLLLLLPLLVHARDADVADLGKVIDQGVKVITAKEARAHIVYLAGPKCEGRASGTAGVLLVARAFAQAPIRPDRMKKGQSAALLVLREGRPKKLVVKRP